MKKVFLFTTFILMVVGVIYIQGSTQDTELIVSSDYVEKKDEQKNNSAKKANTRKQAESETKISFPEKIVSKTKRFVKEKERDFGQVLTLEDAKSDHSYKDLGELSSDIKILQKKIEQEGMVSRANMNELSKFEIVEFSNMMTNLEAMQLLKLEKSIENLEQEFADAR